MTIVWGAYPYTRSDLLQSIWEELGCPGMVAHFLNPLTIPIDVNGGLVDGGTHCFIVGWHLDCNGATVASAGQQEGPDTTQVSHPVPGPAGANAALVLVERCV